MSALSLRLPWVDVGRPSSQLRAAEPRGQGVSLLSQQVGGRPAANSYGKGMSCCAPVPRPACMLSPFGSFSLAPPMGGIRPSFPHTLIPAQRRPETSFACTFPFSGLSGEGEAEKRPAFTWAATSHAGGPTHKGASSWETKIQGQGVLLISPAPPSH